MRGNCDTLVMGSVLLAVSFLVVPARAEDKKPDKTSARFQDDVAPLLAKYCTKCHGVEKPKGHLNLAAIKDEPEATKARKTWEKVRENLEAGAMPPEDEPQPSSEESKRISEWIDGTLTEAKKNDCTGPVDPGRVTLRRLNRAEYKNTIRDLVGISFQPADDFPSDDVGYGFDNIGDVLSLPPLLLERYFAAAEAIAEQAIVTEPIAPGPAKTFEVEDMNDAGGDSFEEMGRILASEGEVAVTFQAPQNGRYILRARAFAQQAGPEKARMAIRVDGKTVKEFEVAAVRSAPELYEISTELKAGARKIGVAFLNDYYKADDPNPGNRDRNLVIDWIEVQGPAAEKSRELPESHRRIVFRTPRNDDWRDAAHEVIDRFATRAYRRPLTPGEVERLVGFVQMAKENGESFERGIQLAVEAVLVSPHFLFKVESDRGGKRTGAAQPISEFELATRLSFFLWSTMPDDELISLAAKKELRNQLEPQVRRMLKDPKAQALVENFAGQWLQLRLLKTVSPDVGRFPTFNDDLRAAMLKETELFFASIMNEDRSVLEFLDADYSFLNERLARHYGISGVQGDEFRRVALTGGDQRGGLLTQASILTVTSNPTRTSPVKRGKWILEQILGTPPPPPPPDVPVLKEGKEALTGSLRQRMEQHRANPACASCHAKMDPLGFGFENFDAIGAWRDKDGAFAVDASGKLPSGQSFQGPKELKAILKQKDREFVRCLTEKMLTYAIGRGVEESDHCAVDPMVDAVAKQGYKFSTLVVEITKSDAFQKRRAKGSRQ